MNLTTYSHRGYWQKAIGAAAQLAIVSTGVKSPQRPTLFRVLRLIERTSKKTATMPMASPSHCFSTTERPHTINAIIRAMTCHPIAAPGPFFTDCFPAANQR